MAKKIYHYDKDTFEYICQGEANLDPVTSKLLKKDVYTKPAYSTYTRVPKLEEGEIAKYVEKDDSWEVIKSNKGKYKLNILTGELSFIKDNKDLECYEYVVPDNILNDFKNNPINYDIVDGKLTDISKSIKYRKQYNIRKFKQLIQEAKEAYVKFRETPVEYKGKKYLPRYLDDYTSLANRGFPMEIWDYTGTKSTVMSKPEFMALKDFLDALDREAYTIKKHAIRRYKNEIEKLGGNND